MNRLTRTIGALGLAGMITGCDSYYSDNTPPIVALPPLETISGRPVGVANYVSRMSSGCTLALNSRGNTILAEVDDFHYDENLRQVVGGTPISALVQSEMNDGDNEDISLTGHYVRNGNLGRIFCVHNIRANGYTFDIYEPRRR